MSSTYLPPALGESMHEVFYPDVQTTVNLFAIHLRSVGADWDYPAHEHPQYELNYVTEGEQYMTVNGKLYIQKAGELLLIPPGSIHSSLSHNGKGFTYFCMHFDIDDQLFLSLLARIKQVLFDADSPVTRQIEPVLRKLMSSADNRAASTMVQRMQLQSAVFELFGHLWEAVSQEAAQMFTDGYEKIELAHQIRNRLQGLVSQQFKQGRESDSHYGIDDIAAELGISSSHCNRVFRQVYGQSPRVYLSEMVLHEAKVLLGNPKLSVQNIAAMLGYKDIAHFSRQFKRWSGISPTRYRQEQPVPE
ncbi:MULTISPECIES: helix-turn-helix domain-containing protein [unclassified Paenibacillus]|uniref:helix-turn-helix domain-containing protein n=1 Tax=unclassified Paenibacillus TaxID=185978 RepID=UPI0009A817EE|nr:MULTISPECIES: AraC family transcriptional regulator [unclassified Paenibacillus]SLK09184.1 AraC-like ligand binding domain-containing protein [Paenibacillus sp. RU5A]SOC71434.1 AraC-like ligand binding domain-containing protein [Paenibacillus sp. RU26A]SOC73882.1 AraC-like ligand binding domain-containing protein [Paenibacillus sp. RU5M]